MPRYSFTHEHAIAAGKKRAAIAAEQRRNNPTPAEAKARAAVQLLEPSWVEYEHPIQTQPGLTQYLDIAIQVGWYKIAIEVDGSHGWHSHVKMAAYDEIKARWCEASGWIMVQLNGNMENKSIQQISEIIKEQYNVNPADCKILR